MPDVSVLIPACGAQATIRDCVLSVLAGGAAVEVLVESDDGSDYAMVADLAHVAVSGAVRSGVGAARNRALARATAPWVAYVDADDRVAPGYFAALLSVAREAAFARTRVIGAEVLGEIGGAVMDFDALGREGGSFRGLVRRELCPVFENDLSQDVMHTAEILLAHGSQPMADTVHDLHLGPATVTAADDFSARVEEAYLRHMARLQARHGKAPDLPAALAMFERKRALNRAFTRDGAGRSYYAWVLQGK